MKAKEIESFEDYKNWKLLEKSNLTLEQIFIFCSWCANRIYNLCKEEVKVDLSEEEINQVKSILQQLRYSAEKLEILPKSQAEQFTKKLDELGKKDEEGALEVEAETLKVFLCIWDVLDYCTDNNFAFACSASENIVNLIDFRLGGILGYELENMFTFEELKSELLLQERVVEYLKNNENLKAIWDLTI